MAVTASGFYGQTLLDSLDATAAARDLTDGANNKLSMCTNSATPDFNDTTPYFTAGGTEFDNKASGVTDAVLVSQTATISGGTLTWDADDWEQAASTITNAEAAVLYDDTGVNNDMLALSDFTTAYSTVSGTFKVQWAVGGIATIDYTP